MRAIIKQGVFKYLGFSILLILLVSCEEGENQQNPPNETEASAETTMSFEVNGETFTASMAYYRDHEPDRMGIYCEVENGSNLYIQLPKVFQEFTFELEQADFLWMYAKYEWVESGDTILYVCGDVVEPGGMEWEYSKLGSGQFTNEFYDVDSEAYDGSFRFTLHNTNDPLDSIQVTHGMFSNLRSHLVSENPPQGSVGLWLEGRYYLVDDFDARISGGRILISELRDSRISGLDRLRVEYPLDVVSQSSFLIDVASIVVAVDTNNLRLAQACGRVQYPTVVEVSSANETFSGKIRSATFLDVEVIFNKVQLNYPLPLNKAGFAQLQINGQTVVFDSIEATGNLYTINLNAFNSDGHVFTIEDDPNLGNSSFIGNDYSGFCLDRYSSIASYDDGSGELVFFNGFTLLNEYPYSDNYRNIQFQGHLDGEDDIVFGADSIYVQ